MGDEQWHDEHPSIQPRSEASFWLQTLTDHTFFIMGNLGPGERDAITQAQALLTRFRQLNPCSPRAAIVSAIRDLINFKRMLLRRLMACRLNIHLHASDLKHMIKEAEDGLRAFGALPGLTAPCDVLFHLHSLWLSDAAGHSTMLYTALDPDEDHLFHQLRASRKVLSDIFLQALEKKDIYRRISCHFNSLRSLSRHADMAIRDHLALMHHMLDMMRRCEIEISAPPLMLQHMIREETHYLCLMWYYYQMCACSAAPC